MDRLRVSLLRGAMLVLLASACGCQTAGLRLLSLIGLNKNPVVVALVVDRQKEQEASALTLLNPFAAYEPLQGALRQELGQPVGLDLCLPFQLQFSLGSRLSHVALVSPATYARLEAPEQYPVLAIPVDRLGRNARPALLITAGGSPIERVEDLRGRKVLFGPSNDARMHYAAVQLLGAHGLKPDDLASDWLPLAGTGRHASSAKAVVRAVLRGQAEAGFADALALDELDEEYGKDAERVRGELRILDRTVALPDHLVLGSPKLDPALQERVVHALLMMDERHPDALRPLNLSAYEAPTPEILSACASVRDEAPPLQMPETEAPAPGLAEPGKTAP